MRTRADARLDLAGRVHHDLYGFPARRDLHAARGKSGAAVASALGECCKSNSQETSIRAGVTLARAEFRQIDFGGGDLQRFDIAAFA